jgi:16S rRNA (cytidine1402-2'-O)-methyltransferase
MLFIVGSPIGNMKDLSIRQAETLCSSDIILSEDTRSAQQLLQSVESLFLMKRKTKLRVISYYKEKELEKLPEILGYLEEGKQVSLISESGLPLLSDPGTMLLQSAIREGIPNTIIPGPSAPTTAFMYAATGTQQFSFFGFLPKKANEKEKFFAHLSNLKTGNPKTSYICFESPQRIESTLQLLHSILPKAQLTLCREMTKLHEEIIRGTPEEVLDQLSKPPKGEITLVIR